MAVTLAKDIIDRAKIVLQDTSVAGTRWPNSELQAWLNDAQFAVVLYRPDAKTVNEEFTPTANSSKQTIPLTGLRLIEVIRNTAATSTYKAIRLIQRSILDDQVPAWHNATASVNIEHFVYDERDPKVFYLFPRPTSATRIELISFPIFASSLLAKLISAGLNELIVQDKAVFPIMFPSSLISFMFIKSSIFFA